MKRLALALFLIPIVFGLGLSVNTYPASLSPGTSGYLILTLTGNAENVRVKFFDNILNMDTGVWEDIGDVQDMASYPVPFSVPSDAKPGVYPIHLVLSFESGGTSYEEHKVLYITISPQPPQITPTSTPTCGQISSLTLKIENSGPTIHSATLYGPFYGSSFVYLGDLEPNSEKEVTVKVLVPWSPYFIPLRLISPDGNYEYNIGISCKGGSGIYVSILPRELNLGENNVEVIIGNSADVPLGPVVVQITSDAILGGETTKVVYLGPRDIRTIPISVEGSSKAVTIAVNVIEGNLTLPFSFVLPVKSSPDVVVYLAGQPEVSPSGTKVTLGVANVGDVEVKNVVAEVEGSLEGMEFIGDLSPGDYDTVTFTVRDLNTLHVTVEYRYLGEKYTIEKNIELPRIPKTSDWLWIVGILVVASIGLYLWRKKR